MLDGKLTTSEAAEAVGLHLVTLQRWIAAGKIKATTPILIGAVGYRLWTNKDVEGLRKIKKQIYRKGRGRKPKPSSKKTGRTGAAHRHAPNQINLIGG